jgi:hypothetical protein
MLVCANAQAAPSNRRLIVVDTRATGTFDPKAVAGVSSLIASEAARHPIKVVGGSDLVALLGLDRQKQLLGCTETSCLAELGGALGARYLLASEVSEVGGVWLLTLTLLDTARAQPLGRLTRKAQRMSGLVDLAPAAVHELLQPLAAFCRAAGGRAGAGDTAVPGEARGKRARPCPRRCRRRPARHRGRDGLVGPEQF